MQEITLMCKNGYITQTHGTLSKIADAYSNYLSINQFNKINSKKTTFKMDLNYLLWLGNVIVLTE